MKLFVTGGAGFIGSNFIHYWLDVHPDDHITNFDALTYAGHPSSLSDITSSNYRFIQGDICDRNLVNQSLQNHDVIVHFAAETHVDRSIQDPSVFVKTNVLGTQVLLDAALEAKVGRFHHISTDEVFGSLSLESTNKFNETTPYQPHSPYSASKAASDHLVRSYADTYGLSISITNCSNNFGPYQDPEKFIPRIITNLIDGKKAPVYGDGLYIRDWLYVKDHCRAIDLVISKGESGSTYCVGGMTKYVNNLHIVNRVIELLGKSSNDIEHVADRPGHDRRYAVDWTKIKDNLNWRPEADFDTWLQRTVEWYQNHQDWWKPLKTRSESIYQ